ncbi:hypothetical protein GCM10022243_34330 [Saccharothrix violaceirubra]|uniref:Uncharacterized protein n=1 Tax=Saccharothrix violaceirubra TaxID=413306 RepID=A0A7W7WWK8_9PSEU|nr:hypothetical protein [Saccharothrix violaceirubra]MBB4966484.1 hypothetical protein [Saccharothrix violaceirubra]
MPAVSARPGPERTRRWERRTLRITDFGLPAPEIGGEAYRTRLDERVQAAIAAGAVDLGTGDMFDALIEADRRTDQCRLTDEATRWWTRARQVLVRHERRYAHAERLRVDLSKALHAEVGKLEAIDRALAARRAEVERERGSR